MYKMSPPQNISLIVPIKIDFAVYSKQTSNINLKNPLDHIVELDAINISETLFKSIFYQTDNFSINPNISLSLLNYVSFINKTVLGVEFSLIDELIKNFENDLGVSSSMFSPCTNIALHKEINAIKSLCDLIQSGTIICSMTWTDIVNSIRCETTNNVANVILILSVVFTNQTAGINSTIIKFNFNTTVTIQ
jgi:hypothetical protein